MQSGTYMQFMLIYDNILQTQTSLIVIWTCSVNFSTEKVDLMTCPCRVPYGAHCTLQMWLLAAENC